MKELIKSIGIILILIGIGILAYSFLNQRTTNTWLIISAALVVFGLLSYIVTNKYML
jgi:hypothetical protein